MSCRRSSSWADRSAPVNALKRRRLCGSDRAASFRRVKSLSARKPSPSAAGVESAVQLMQKLELPIKAIPQEECDKFLTSLDLGSRASMEVRVSTTMNFQRFLNAGMMSQEELSKMQSLVQELGSLVDREKGPRVLFINATELGGGVAEMRLDTIALCRDLNLRAQWLVIDGAERFYNVTVHMHEGIQNPNYAPLAPHEIEIFHLNTIANFLRLEKDHPLSEIDVIWIDDPQPLGLAPLLKILYPKMIVVWRCHVHLDAEPSIRSFINDLTSGNLHPDRDNLLLHFLRSRGHGINVAPPVDLQVFHREVFATNLGLPLGKAHIMPPCINPLSFKNLEINDSLIRSTLVKYGIMPGPKDGCYSNVPPYILEVSRFDPYKGPLELITAFRDATLTMPLKLQSEIRLVLVSSLPGDNPSGVRLARLLQEYVDSLDLSAFPEEQRAGAPNDLRKRIHLLMLDDKAPWERLLERLHQVRKSSGEVNADRVTKIAREVRDLARVPIPDAVASLQHCGLVSPEVAAALAADPLPDGVSFSPQQKLALLDILESRRAQHRVDPGGTAVTRRRAEQDCLTGKEINAFEVNALQSGALITVQFSSKEGFGLTVSESLVKSVPGYEGLTICTLVGGIRPQAEACDCFKIEYPVEEVSASLKEYRSLPDYPSTSYLRELFSRIASRSSVALLVDFIRTGAALPKEERQRRCRAAREAVFANFSTWVNVHNILKGMVQAGKCSVLGA